MIKKIGLFIPCYVNEFYPNVAIDTLTLLEKFGYSVDYPLAQTCCGQPLANTGNEAHAQSCYNNFVNIFAAYDYIVCPSGSCVYHVKHHYDIIKQSAEVTKVRTNTYDLVDFLTTFCDIKRFKKTYSKQIGIHLSCHALRGLNQATPSEISSESPSFAKIYNLLQNINGIKITTLSNKDECCGFGGAFSIYEDQISVKMGKDRLDDHINNNTQVITSGDMSCLMHLSGIIKRNKINLEIKHIAQILAEVIE
jgi:L-lactate dehydrogenase complex protein LldE